MLIGPSNTTCKFNGVSVVDANALYQKSKSNPDGTIEWNGRAWGGVVKHSTSVADRRLKIAWVIGENGVEYQFDANETIAYSVAPTNPCLAWKKIKTWFELKEPVNE